MLELSLPPTRYEVWLDKMFKGLPDELKKHAVEKWLKIREWHLAERMVWRALSKWRSVSTPGGKQRALDNLRKRYETRCETLKAASDAHFAISVRMTKDLHRAVSREVYDMIVRHPGWFPPRSK